MKILFKIMILATVFSCVAFSQADKVSSSNFTAVKVLDGFEAQCDSYNETQINSQRPVNYKIISITKQGSLFKAHLEISYLTCKNNRWAPNVNTSIEYQYKDSIGQVISESVRYQKEKILVKDKDNKVIDTIFLSEPSYKPTKVMIKIDTRDIPKDPLTKTKFVDIILTAEQVKKNPADYNVSEVNWGHLRLDLN